MAKFFITSIFRIGNVSVLSGKVDEGSISIGMKLQNAPTDLSITEIEKNNKKVPSAAQGEMVGIKVPYHKIFERMSNTLVEFA